MSWALANYALMCKVGQNRETNMERLRKLELAKIAKKGKTNSLEQSRNVGAKVGSINIILD